MIAFRLGAVVFSLSVVGVVGEILIGQFRPQQTYAVLESMLGYQYAESPFNVYTLKQNFRGTAPSQEYPGHRVKVSINSLRLRGREITEAKPAGTRRVVVLGDSYTFGVFVEDHETYSAVLERELVTAGHAFEVLNAGYTAGWETDEHYCWLVNRGLDFDPDVVILGFFTGNDIMQIDPAIWEATDDRGLPTKIHDPRLYIDNLGRARAATADNKRAVGDQFVYRIPILRNSHLAVVLGLLLDRTWQTVFDEPQENLDRDFVWPHIFKDSSAEFDRQEEYFLRLVQGMKETCDERGTRFMVLMIAFPFQVFPDTYTRFGWGGYGPIRRDYFEELSPQLDAMGIPSINLIREMRNRPGRYYPLNGEVHLNPLGHEFVGQQIAAKMAELGWLADP